MHTQSAAQTLAHLGGTTGACAHDTKLLCHVWRRAAALQQHQTRHPALALAAGAAAPAAHAPARAPAVPAVLRAARAQALLAAGALAPQGAPAAGAAAHPGRPRHLPPADPVARAQLERPAAGASAQARRQHHPRLQVYIQTRTASPCSQVS